MAGHGLYAHMGGGQLELGACTGHSPDSIAWSKGDHRVSSRGGRAWGTALPSDAGHLDGTTCSMQ